MSLFSIMRRDHRRVEEGDLMAPEDPGEEEEQGLAEEEEEWIGDEGGVIRIEGWGVEDGSEVGGMGLMDRGGIEMGHRGTEMVRHGIEMEKGTSADHLEDQEETEIGIDGGSRRTSSPFFCPKVCREEVK